MDEFFNYILNYLGKSTYLISERCSLLIPVLRILHEMAILPKFPSLHVQQHCSQLTHEIQHLFPYRNLSWALHPFFSTAVSPSSCVIILGLPDLNLVFIAGTTSGCEISFHCGSTLFCRFDFLFLLSPFTLWLSISSLWGCILSEFCSLANTDLFFVVANTRYKNWLSISFLSLLFGICPYRAALPHSGPLSGNPVVFYQSWWSLCVWKRYCLKYFPLALPWFILYDTWNDACRYQCKIQWQNDLSWSIFFQLWHTVPLLSNAVQVDACCSQNFQKVTYALILFYVFCWPPKVKSHLGLWQQPIP